jgi:hypothetical protein
VKNVVKLALAGAACALLFVMPSAAADHTAPQQKNAIKTQAMRAAWPPETLSGKIAMVDPSQRLLVITNDGVPFDLVITPRTHIRSGDRTLSLKDLKQYQNGNVSLKFVPERRGDVAESIHVNG